MWRCARLTLMWLLVVALPLQGAVAASMLACGAGVASAAGREAVAEAVVDGFAVVARDSASDDEAENLAEDGAVTCPHALDAATADGDAPASHATARRCPLCAALCLVVALPTQTVRTVGARPRASYLPFTARAVPPFLTPGIERPPRSVSA